MICCEQKDKTGSAAHQVCERTHKTETQTEPKTKTGRKRKKEEEKRAWKLRVINSQPSVAKQLEAMVGCFYHTWMLAITSENFQPLQKRSIVWSSRGSIHDDLKAVVKYEQIHDSGNHDIVLSRFPYMQKVSNLL